MSKITQSFPPIEPKCSVKENKEITIQIEKIIQKDALVRVSPVKEQFLSNIFLVPKADGSFRLIIHF